MYKVEIFELVNKRTRRILTETGIALDAVVELINQQAAKNVKIIISNIDVPKAAHKKTAAQNLGF